MYSGEGHSFPQPQEDPRTDSRTHPIMGKKGREEGKEGPQEEAGLEDRGAAVPVGQVPAQRARNGVPGWEGGWVVWVWVGGLGGSCLRCGGGREGGGWVG